MVSNHYGMVARIFDRLPSLNYKVTSVTANGDRVFMEYIRTVDGEDEMVLDIRDEIAFAYIMGTLAYSPFISLNIKTLFASNE
jgi:hypothetical protein